MSRRELALLQGTLDLLVLKALEGGPQHGYAVARWVRETTEGELEVEDGALYTSLHRMERKGWLAPTWGLSENNRKAKYYALTRAGRRELASETQAWGRYVAAVGKVLRSAGVPT
jgi:PadR family transcriptional regulator, regulatory protein PadR